MFQHVLSSGHNEANLQTDIYFVNLLANWQEHGSLRLFICERNLEKHVLLLLDMCDKSSEKNNGNFVIFV